MGKRKRMNKKALGIFMFMALVLIVSLGFSSNTYAATYKGFNFKPGDILITKSTSSAGLTGHASIVDQKGTGFVTILGPGHTATGHSIKWWFDHYPATKVVRYKSATKAKEAASYAYNNYKYGKYTNRGYKVTPNPKDRTYLYCSEIVWQAYYYGAGVTYYDYAGRTSQKIIPIIIAPYDYTNSFLQGINGFATVKSFSW
ncbi:hypothetical protein [Heyndrickxia coagulans]|uniref:hypothetical protein n=1 Tax=Heyndrickxia coagulans TaxID=1398 RepID=UPI002E1C6BC5|nr:hypothetical protein [Heyndrickxia coagulans]